MNVLSWLAFSRFYMVVFNFRFSVFTVFFFCLSFGIFNIFLFIARVSFLLTSTCVGPTVLGTL